MSTRQRRKTISRHLVLPAVTVAFLCYFAYHAFHGDYGLFARARFDHQAEMLRKELASVRAQRELLESRVVLLRPESLDPDMIDERARQSLNVAHPNELIILRPQKGQ